jgi:hypothetical protein
MPKIWANRDLNAYVNIVHALMRGVGFQTACEAGGEKS